MKEKSPGKDPRYIITGKLIKGGFIKNFLEIFDTIPKSVVARDLKIHGSVMNKRLLAPEKFESENIIFLSQWMNVCFEPIAKMWLKASKKSMQKKALNT